MNDIDKAIKAASKKMPLASVKQRNTNLELTGCDMAEAYEIGVEECQREIVTRLMALKIKEEKEK